MKQNLGIVDRIMRFALAFWWLGPFQLRYGVAWLDWVLLAVGWIALLESFSGWCWLHSLWHINNKNQ